MSQAEILLHATAGSSSRHATPRVAFIGLTVLFSVASIAAFAVSVSDWTPMAFLALVLVGASAVWIAGGAATAVIGAMLPRQAGAPTPHAFWQPTTQTAILVTLCGEDPAPVARYLADLRRQLDHLPRPDSTRIFVLSDTSDPEKIEAEETALSVLRSDGAISYRRREMNTGRKPGNIAEWVETQGTAFNFMLVLDADSRMSAARIHRMIRTLETRPQTGLLQAAITLAPGATRFDRHQRISARFLSPNFVQGFAAWTGETGNYWGHNALIRVDAFRSVARLPALSGSAPLGGPVLSHDFIEAAYMRKNGWAVELDAELAGSAEHAPQTLEEFHRRDRRWCQGNLQHMRLLGAPGLHPISRFHLASGVFSYLSAPIWLALVAMIASGAVEVAGALPFVLIIALLLLPKASALPDLISRARTFGRRMTILRAALAEAMMSALIAPLVMVRQSVSVLAVLVGRDCGWKSGRAARFTLPNGVLEMAFGALILSLTLVAGTGTAVLWLAPLVLPLLAAPLLIHYLDAPA